MELKRESAELRRDYAFDISACAELTLTRFFGLWVRVRVRVRVRVKG